MTTRLTRHQRVVNVRDLILKGKTIGELHGILFKMGVSKGTAQSYIDEAVSDIKKKMKK
ncbi:MAG: hypothetical protein ACW99F_14395 [Candidatus Hodarchaeales archaeon]